jgi:hypothetical protein
MVAFSHYREVEEYGILLMQIPNTHDGRLRQGKAYTECRIIWKVQSKADPMCPLSVDYEQPLPFCVDVDCRRYRPSICQGDRVPRLETELRR